MIIFLDEPIMCPEDEAAGATWLRAPVDVTIRMPCGVGKVGKCYILKIYINDL